jgi:CheY-like chemotaxis protein
MEISSALEATGCTVLGPAKNEAQAMALLGQGPPPDAVLLDLNLAGASSAPIAVELRARGIPFVVTSGYTQSLATEPALHDAAWLNKPIEHDRLVRMLRRLLEPNPG